MVLCTKRRLKEGGFGEYHIYFLKQENLLNMKVNQIEKFNIFSSQFPYFVCILFKTPDSRINRSLNFSLLFYVIQFIFNEQFNRLRFINYQFDFLFHSLLYRILSSITLISNTLTHKLYNIIIIKKIRSC